MSRTEGDLQEYYRRPVDLDAAEQRLAHIVADLAYAPTGTGVANGGPSSSGPVGSANVRVGPWRDDAWRGDPWRGDPWRGDPRRPGRRSGRTRRAPLFAAVIVALLVLAIAGTALLWHRHGDTAPAVHPNTSSTVHGAEQLDPGFADLANAVCRPYVLADAKIRFPYPSFDPERPTVRLLPSIAAFEQAHDDGDRLLAAIRHLGVPTTGRTPWTNAVTLFAADVQVRHEQTRAASRSDATAFVRTVETLASLQPRITAALAAAGMSAADPCPLALTG